MNTITEKATTSERLNEIMQEKHIKQADIIRLAEPYYSKYGTRISRSDLSQYVNGKTTPHQAKLSILSAALGVTEAWLMGYDVQKYVDTESIKPSSHCKRSYDMSSTAQKCVAEDVSHESYYAVTLFNRLNAKQRQHITGIMESMLNIHSGN